MFPSQQPQETTGKEDKSDVQLSSKGRRPAFHPGSLEAGRDELRSKGTKKPVKAHVTACVSPAASLLPKHRRCHSVLHRVPIIQFFPGAEDDNIGSENLFRTDKPAGTWSLVEMHLPELPCSFAQKPVCPFQGHRSPKTLAGGMSPPSLR